MLRFLFGCLFVLPFSTFSQSTNVNGTIMDLQEEDIIGSISVYTFQDSTLIKGSYLDSSYFSFEFDRNGGNNFYAKIKVFGYHDSTINFTVSNEIVSLGNIELKRIEVEGVEVIYTRPVYEKTMDGIKVNIEGTNLETLANLYEVLKASPKIVSPDGESIEIAGKGAPLILIDRQPILSIEELKVVPADQIHHIEIITNPSAKYQAEGRGGGVIEVFTKQFHLEGYNASVNVRFGMNTQTNPSFGTSLGFSFKKEKFSFSSFLNGYNDTRSSNNLQQGSTSDNTLREYNKKATSISSFKGFHLNLKSTYQINNNQKINVGIRSNGYFNLRKDNLESSYFEKDSLTFSQISMSENNWNWVTNNAFINYSWLTDTLGSSLTIDLNYWMSFRDESNTSNSEFSEVGQLNSYTSFKNNMMVRPISGRMRLIYEHYFDSTGWKLNSGTEFNLSNNKKRYDQYYLEEGNWINDDEQSNSYDYQDLNIGVFSEISKMWDLFGFKFGIRGEFNSLYGYSNSLNKTFMDSTYTLPFPIASVMIKPSEKLSFTVIYQSGISRPMFDNFDPFRRVIDSLNIIQGNPYLRPQLNKSLGLEIDILNKFNINLEYNLSDLPMSNLSFLDDSLFVLTTTPWNAKRKQQLSLNTGLSINEKWVKGYNSIWIDYFKYDFGPEFGRQPFYGVSFGFSSRMTFILPKNLDITNGMHLLRFSGNNSTQQPRFYWDIRITKKFKNEKFQMYLSINDIIALKTRSTSYSGNFVELRTGQYNFANFRLGLFYKFGRLKDGRSIDSE